VHGGRKEAERELARLVVDTPTSRASRQTSRTVGQLLTVWLERHTGDTLVTYRAAIAHLPERAHRVKLSRVELRDIDAWYSEMTKVGVSPGQVRKAHAAVSAALTQAVRWGWITVNPARGAQLPTVVKTPLRIPTDPEIAALLAACTSLDARVWLRLVLATGARRGELLAVRWSDLDGDRLGISGSMQEDGTVKSTKTNRPRVVVLDQGTVTLLDEWRTAQHDRAAVCGTTLDPNGFILSHDPEGVEPWRPDGVTQRFRRLRKRAGVTGVRLHDLRHWHASQLLASNGGDVVAVSERIGHSRVSTTLDVYGAVVDGRDRAQAALIGELLS
jgi:integrase